MTLIGSSEPRIDGEEKVRGQAVYGFDYAEPGMLHGIIVRSTVPAARNVRVDCAFAEKMPGVRAIATARDAPHRAGMVVQDEELFASARIVYAGQPLAAVAADSIEAARAAAKRIAVAFEAEEPVLNLRTAAVPSTRAVHQDWAALAAPPGLRRGHNIAAEADCGDRDVDEMFENAPFVVCDEFESPRQYQAYLEPKASVCSVRAGRVVVHTATQAPYNVQERVAQFLGIRVSDVRVIGHVIGGGFGGKLDASVEPYAALLARMTGRPVRVANDRTSDLISCPARENAVVRLRSAVDADGRILARSLVCLMDAGAYSGESPVLASIPMHIAASTYRADKVHVSTRLLYTNTAPTGPFRGVGGLYLCHALERHMDHIAAELSIDRRQLRMQNLVRPEDCSATGQRLSDAGILASAFAEVEKIAPWPAESSLPPGRGVGLAAAFWTSSPLAGQVTVKLNDDGTVGVVTAATEAGSGALATAIPQVVAAEMRVESADIRLLLPDTDAAAYDAGSLGSRTTHVTGRAALEASVRLRARVLGCAAQMLGVSPDRLDLTRLGIRLDRERIVLSLSDIAAAARTSTGALVDSASFCAPVPKFDAARGSGVLAGAFAGPTWHVHRAEVEVDEATGNVRVTDYVVAQEVGRAVNPAAIRGQIQGGVLQGIGFTLYEAHDLVDGQYAQQTLAACRLPLAANAPEVRSVLLEDGLGAGPYGAKGVGEPTIVPVAAAVACAVSDAIGWPVDALPITPEVVLECVAERDRSLSEVQPAD